MWDHLGLGSPEIIRAHLGSSGIIWAPMESSSVLIPAHLGSSGLLWDRLGHLGSAGVICHHLGSSELIWDHKLQYLSAKMQKSMFFVNFTKCF